MWNFKEKMHLVEIITVNCMKSHTILLCSAEYWTTCHSISFACEGTYLNTVVTESL